MISPEQHAEVKAFYDAENERMNPTMRLMEADIAEIAKLKDRIARARKELATAQVHSNVSLMFEHQEKAFKILNEP